VPRAVGAPLLLPRLPTRQVCRRAVTQPDAPRGVHAEAGSPGLGRTAARGCHQEVLSSRVLLRPSDRARSQAFYADVLGLPVYREFGPPEHPAVVFFLGNGLLEVSGQSEEPPVGLALWLQVRTSPRSTIGLRPPA
jgi:hypothetical protein